MRRWMRTAQPSLRLVAIPIRWFSLDEVHLIFHVSGVQDVSFELWRSTLGFPTIIFPCSLAASGFAHQFARTRSMPIVVDADLVIDTIPHFMSEHTQSQSKCTTSTSDLLPFLLRSVYNL